MSSSFDTRMNFNAPALPLTSGEYNQMYFDQYNDTLRVYFNQLDGAASKGLAQEYSQSVAWFMG
tara:strand:- start:830 stop:1021 length:192 start_codon:yes stop_codon:yes gene_type:complete